jgi:dolichyl-phosphate-mannose-protein mannosyltransferase
MMTSNNALVPDPDKEDIIASVPTDWPFLHLGAPRADWLAGHFVSNARTGMRMNGWGEGNPKYYLVRPICLGCTAVENAREQIGNPVVWWTGAVSLIFFVGSVLWYLMRFQRKITTDFAPGALALPDLN